MKKHSLNSNSLLFLFGALLLFVSTAGCSTAVEQDSETDEYQYDTSVSELSNVMRQMYDESLQARENVIAERPAEIDWELFKKIAHSEVTRPSLKEGVFQQQSEQFLQSVKDLNNNPDNPIAAYNVMIVNCLNCHTNRCPGPMPRIKKLEIANL